MRLIDADAALENMNKGLNVVYDLTDLPEYLAGCTTIDAAPVVHARWIHPVPGDGEPYCSNCKKYSPLWTPYFGFFNSDYCPRCGARMDSKEE